VAERRGRADVQLWGARGSELERVELGDGHYARIKRSLSLAFGPARVDEPASADAPSPGRAASSCSV